MCALDREDTQPHLTPHHTTHRAQASRSTVPADKTHETMGGTTVETPRQLIGAAIQVRPYGQRLLCNAVCRVVGCLLRCSGWRHIYMRRIRSTQQFLPGPTLNTNRSLRARCSCSWCSGPSWASSATRGRPGSRTSSSSCSCVLTYLRPVAPVQIDARHRRDAVAAVQTLNPPITHPPIQPLNSATSSRPARR